jgi:hypothetical protein
LGHLQVGDLRQLRGQRRPLLLDRAAQVKVSTRRHDGEHQDQDQQRHPALAFHQVRNEAPVVRHLAENIPDEPASRATGDHEGKAQGGQREGRGPGRRGQLGIPDQRHVEMVPKQNDAVPRQQAQRHHQPASPQPGTPVRREREQQHDGRHQAQRDRRDRPDMSAENDQPHDQQPGRTGRNHPPGRKPMPPVHHDEGHAQQPHRVRHERRHGHRCNQPVRNFDQRPEP